MREQLAVLAEIGVTDFAAVEVGTNPDERARTRAFLAQIAKEEL